MHRMRYIKQVIQEEPETADKFADTQETAQLGLKGHICCISCNLSGEIESVKSLVLTRMPRQLTHVDGLTNLLNFKP